jgi:hypothetical protein
MGIQQRINYLYYTACWVAPLSIVGSCLTLRAIFYQYKDKRQLTTYQRLLLGISTSDLMLSTALAFGPIPMPAGLQDHGIPAFGTVSTCTAQGFFMQLGSASFVYSQMLMFYFVLVIKYNVTSKFLETRIEPIMHSIPIGFHGFTSLLGLALDVFNPSGVSCWVGGSPTGCEDDPEVECERGGNSVAIFGKWLVAFPFLFWSGWAIVWTILIAVTVYQQNRTRFQYQFGWSNTFAMQTTETNNQTNTTTINTRSSRIKNRMSISYGYARRESQSRLTDSGKGQTKLRQAITQAFLYGIWYINFTIWSCLNLAFSLAGRERDVLGKHFWLTAIALTLFPSQGLFNFVIYIRPTYLNIRETFPQQGRWFAVKESVWRPFATSQERARAASNNYNSSSGFRNNPEVQPNGDSCSQPVPGTGKESEKVNNMLSNDQSGIEIEETKESSNDVGHATILLPEEDVANIENYA